MDCPEANESTEEVGELFVDMVARGLEEAKRVFAKQEEMLARQIVLLEAHMAQTRINQAKLLISAYETADDPALLEVAAELRDSYAEYAAELIHKKALSPRETIQVFKRLHAALEAAFANLNSLMGGFCRLTDLAIYMVGRRIHEVLAAILTSLRTASDTAWFRMPLSAYGPELSEYRHRLR